MKTVFIALGGNLGDVKAAFQSARNTIAALPDTELINSSSLYRTPPVGPAGQPDSLNAVIAVTTAMQAIERLEAFQAIDLAHGRERKEHWGARTLDLDIVAIDQNMISSERLSVPLPLMFGRLFVLRPLCDLAPQWQHPQLKLSAAEGLEKIIAAGEPPLPEGEAW